MDELAEDLPTDDYQEPRCSTDCSNWNSELYLSSSLGGGLFGCIVLDRVSITAMKHYGQNQLGGRGFSFALDSTSQYITEESQSRDSSIDPEARTTTSHGGVLLTGL